MKRLEALAAELAPSCGADAGEARRAARLAKADLVSGMVGEFPELQGLMGRYYATHQGESAAVATAIEDHYRPQGPSDRVPSNPVAVAVALADKLDLLTGFWAIDEKPTGSKDPFALRRAALGVIRIILENKLRLKLSDVLPVTLLAYLLWGLEPHSGRYRSLLGAVESKNGSLSSGGWSKPPYRYYLNHDGMIDQQGSLIASVEFSIIHETDENAKEAFFAYSQVADRLDHMDTCIGVIVFADREISAEGIKGFYESRKYSKELWHGAAEQIFDSWMGFFADRLKVHLKEEGARHDLIDAVFALGGQDDLLMVVRRVEALGAFLATEDGANLLAGYKRAVNILKAEEKKDGAAVSGRPVASHFREEAEIALASAIDKARAAVSEALSGEDFAAAMEALAALRAPVDRFFADILVNADEAELRANRLKLLAEIRDIAGLVADFSKVSG